MSVETIRATFDTTLNENVPSGDMGSDSLVNLGRQNTKMGGYLIRSATHFDLSSFPASLYVLNSAKIWHRTWSYPNNSPDMQAYYRRLDPFSAGANWNTKDGATVWTTPGGDFYTGDGLEVLFTPPSVGTPTNPFSVTVTDLIADARDNRGNQAYIIGMGQLEASPENMPWVFFSDDYWATEESNYLEIDVTKRLPTKLVSYRRRRS